MPPSDEQLVKKFKAGEVEAFEELVTRYERKVYNLAYRFTGNHADAGDLAQEVFIRVFRSIRGFREESSFSTWIYTIAVNVCRDELRKRKRRKNVFWEEMSPSQAETAAGRDTSLPEEELERRDLQQLMQHYLRQLPENHRLILLLREMEQLSYEEIASVLNCSIGTVKSRLSRARNALKDIIKTDGELF